MTHALCKIAVDLTPVLPGGENGGAKIFVLDLLRQLARMKPDTEFILLTQAASHDELATLDRPNMHRRMVIGPVTQTSSRQYLKRLAAYLTPRVPARVRGRLTRLGHRLNTVLKRRGAGSLLRKLNVNLLFCPFTAPTYFEPGIPTVCTIYDLQFKTYPEFFSPEDVGHRAQTFNDAARRAAALAAISDYSRDSAILHGDLKPERVRTIHLRMARRIAVDATPDTRALSRLQLARERYLVYPANFWKHKNHEVLLTAFGMACHDSRLPPDIKLVCTGAPGPRRDWLITAVHAMGLAERVIFPGYLPDADLAAVIDNCRGVIFPSLYEGFGLPVLEAMAANVPVACSNTTSLPEVAADAAIMFDPRVPTQLAEAIVSLVNDDTLRGRLVEAGQKRVHEFSDTRRMATEYWDLFQSALMQTVHENLVTGVMPDGWMGSSLKIQTAPVDGTETVEVQICVPDWLPRRTISVQIYRHGKPVGRTIKLRRGSEETISLPTNAEGGIYEVRLSPTFIPARCGIGTDERQLSALLRRCSIVSRNSPRVDLFAEDAPA